MAYFNVTYDLRKKKEFDYEKLWDEFTRLGGHKYQESAYFLDVTGAASDLLATLRQFIHEDDLLMVTEFSVKPRYNRALTGTNEWVSARFP